MKIKYTLEGCGADSVPFEVSGEIDGENVCDRDVHWRAVATAFEALTQGRTIYGRPGEGGCRGPYLVKRFVLETF